MNEKRPQKWFEQLSLFFDPKKQRDEPPSCDRLTDIISKLHAMKSKQYKLEAQKRREQEEKERRETHIREVTCMDLPLDCLANGNAPQSRPPLRS